MTQHEVCSACGGPVKVKRGSYEFREVGLPVTLHGIELLECHQCGNVDPVIPQPNKLMRALAMAVVRKPYHLRGEEVRFLRKYLNMTGEDFSRLIHVDKTTLSKWENNEDRIGDQSDRLIRTIALALGPGLKASIEEVVRRFPDIKSGRGHVHINLDTETMEYQYA